MTTPWSKYSINRNFFTKKNSHYFWLVGLLGADGSIHKQGYTSISQSGDKGEKLIQYLKKLINFNGKIYRSKNAYSIQISDKFVSNNLKKHGIVNNKTLTYVPKNIPKKYFKSFLRGYFEGDGSVGMYRCGSLDNYLIVSFVGTSQFMSFVKNNIPDGFKNKKIKRCKNLEEVRYTGKYAYGFLKWLYQNKTLYKSYKYDIFQDWISQNSNFLELNMKKKKAYKLYNSGTNCFQIAKKIDIPFQTIYKWRKNGFKHF